MTGRTHLAIGTATALWVTKPSDIPSFLICIGVAAVGSVISDIDVKTSTSHRQLNWIMGCAAAIILVAFFAEYKWNIGLLKSFLESGNIMRVVLSFLVFLAVCQFGKHRPHRSFMHSFLGCLILSQIIYFVFPKAAIYFAVAMLSHIALDMLNKKEVGLLYPMRGGFCLKLCSADGIMNRMLFRIGIVGSIFISIQLIAQMKFWNL